jgi:RNA polymerase sigma-70 factor, ECF subfamily
MQKAISPRQGSKQQLWVAAQQIVDSVLLDRIADGDKLAMQALFAQHYLGVYRLVLRLVANEVLAEDIVIEAFVDVWCNAKRFQGNSQVSAWIIAIAQFKAMSSLRRRKDETFDEGAMAAIPDASDDHVIAVKTTDRTAALRACMSQLSRERQPCSLPRDVGGRSRRVSLRRETPSLAHIVKRCIT